MNDQTLYKLIFKYTLCILALLVCTHCSGPYRSLITPLEVPKTQRTLIQDVSVFTAVDTKMLDHQDVLIGDGKILSITPTQKTVPQNVRIISGLGLTLLPGFVDSHVHLTFSGSTPYENISPDPIHNLHAFLYSGITTVYDLGGDAKELRALQKKIEEGTLTGPRIFHTHIPITVPGSHPLPVTQNLLPWPLSSIVSLIIPQIDSLEQVEPVIDDVIELGIDYVKLTADQLPPGTPEMSDSILRAAIQYTQKLGYHSVVHIGGIDKAMIAAQAGASALVHHTWRTNVSSSEAKILAQTGVYYVATISAWEATAAMTEGKFYPSPLAYEITPHRLVNSVRGEAGKRILDIPTVTDMSLFAARQRPLWAPSIKRLYEAGVRFLVGTDAGVPGVFHGSSFHEELKILSQAGVPNATLLIAATANGARWFNPQANFGTIEVGKIADLVLIEGNPLKNIAVTTQIKHVFRAGQEIQRIKINK